MHSILKMKKVLLIDDDEVFLKTAGQVLSSSGYQVVEAKDGKEGLEMVQQEKPDLILLDILMPNLGGMDFLKILKDDKKLNTIPVIIVSNFTTSIRGLELGASGYIVKSNESLKTITNAVEALIGQ